MHSTLSLSPKGPQPHRMHSTTQHTSYSSPPFSPQKSVPIHRSKQSNTLQYKLARSQSKLPSSRRGTVVPMSSLAPSHAVQLCFGCLGISAWSAGNKAMERAPSIRPRWRGVLTPR